MGEDLTGLVKPDCCKLTSLFTKNRFCSCLVGATANIEPSQYDSATNFHCIFDPTLVLYYIVMEVFFKLGT